MPTVASSEISMMTFVLQIGSVFREDKLPQVTQPVVLKFELRSEGCQSSHTTLYPTPLIRGPQIECHVFSYYLDETLQSGALTRNQGCIGLGKGDMSSSI